MRQRPRRFEALHAAVDARGLEDADEDRKRRGAVDFLEIDHLLIVDLADDDPRQFHRDGHGGDPYRNASGDGLHMPLYSPSNGRRVARSSSVRRSTPRRRDGVLADASMPTLPSFASAASTDASCSRSSASLSRCCWTTSAGALSTKPLLASLPSIDADLLGEVVAFFFEPLALGGDVDEAAQIDVDFDRAVLAGERAAGGDARARSAFGPQAVAVARAICVKYGCIGCEQLGRGGVAADGERELFLERDVLALGEFRGRRRARLGSRRIAASIVASWCDVSATGQGAMQMLSGGFGVAAARQGRGSGATFANSCQTSSVRNGIIGCNSRSSTSSAWASTRCAVCRCSATAKRAFVIST